MLATPVLGDPRFFERAGPFTAEEVCAAAHGRFERAETLQGRLLTGVAALQSARADEVAVLHNPRYAEAANGTAAGLVVVDDALRARVPTSSAILVVGDAHAAWARIATLFHPVAGNRPGRHATSVIDATASVDPSAEIGPCAVIGARAEIGAGCRIGAGAVIGPGVVLGSFCRIGASASVSHALLGDRVYVYPGARIGQEGFGFAVTQAGFISVPQLGRVILEDDVEIGANAAVDRGASHDTVVGAGSRIDNLVQIGHNCQLGRSCAMAAQSGMAGSCTLGDFVQMGAQSGLAGHLRVGARARIGAQAGVMSDVPDAADVIGSPALPVREFFRNVAVLRRLARRGPPTQTAAGEKAAG